MVRAIRLAYLERFGVELEPAITSIDGDELSLEWNTKRHYAELEIVDGALSWFFRDRDTGEIQGTEGEPQAPDALIDSLHALISAAAKSPR